MHYMCICIIYIYIYIYIYLYTYIHTFIIYICTTIMTIVVIPTYSAPLCRPALGGMPAKPRSVLRSSVGFVEA